MRQVDLGSNYIQAAGRVSGDTLLCTSLGVIKPVSLGKPNLITEHGVAEYFHRSLSPQQWHPLNVFVSGSFAIIVDPALAVDVPREGPDEELVVFVPSAANRDRIAAVGQNFSPDWFQAIPKGGETTLLDGGYLVTRMRSANWDISVIVATPEHYIYRRVRHFAAFLIPIGMLCGALLAWAVNYLTRLRSSFAATIRRAVKNRNFYVEYQPIVELESRRIIGAEALVRWRSRHADVRPDHFIPLAEERGLIHLITEQVLFNVGKDLPHLLDLNRDFKVAINMSASDLSASSTLEALDQLLRTSGARPQNIELEATERAFLQGPRIAELIDALRATGFSVAIDDFGTGYSSLACLQSLSLDTLKIDRAFVETIGTDGATNQVVQHIIEMAHSLHLEMVAEGVESEAQAQFLAKRNVRYAQGWHFGRPMGVGALCQLIREPTASREVACVGSTRKLA